MNDETWTDDNTDGESEVARTATIMQFLADLRRSLHIYHQPEDNLTDAPIWDVTLAPVPSDELLRRDENSLFVRCVRGNARDVNAVFRIWDQMTGYSTRQYHNVLEQQSAAAAKAEREYQPPGPDSPGRRALLQYLAERGWDDDRINALARR